MKLESDIRQLNTPQLRKAYVERKNETQTSSSTKTTPNATPNFTGGFDLFCRFLDTNQAWGANLVDLGFMVAPRTVTDFSRGANAGMETLRREGFGNANHSMIGLYGTIAGLMLATGINGAYNLGKDDVKVNSIFADSETIDLQGKIYADKLKAAAGNPSANPLREYLAETLKNYESLKGLDENNPKANIWKGFSDKAIEDSVNILEREIKTGGSKLSKEAANNIRTILASDTGLENTYRIVSKAGERSHSSRYSIDSVVENLYKLGKVFSKDKVIDAFKNSTDVADNVFLKALKTMNLKRSLIGIGIASAVGISAQPLNMYLTKLKTGNSNFVGGGEEDKTFGFKVKKAAVALLFGAGVLATIGHPKNLMKNLQFKGLSPTINQFKFIYGVTIMSRFLSARNDNELKEASFKDVLGFANWLLLGNFVQKLVAQSFDKSLIKKSGKGVLNWITGSVLKTRDEVLLKHLGKKAFDESGKALSYTNMVKLADQATKKTLRHLTIAQLAGYAYSGLVLGIGIPRLNIMFTKRRMAKQEAAKAAKAAAQNAQTQQTSAAQNASVAQNQTSQEQAVPQSREFLATKFTSRAFLGN